MKLLELRYRKLPIVDKIMSIVDDAVLGDNDRAAKEFAKYGIDPQDNPEDIRRAVTIMDEFKVMQLYRTLVGGK